MKLNGALSYAFSPYEMAMFWFNSFVNFYRFEKVNVFFYYVTCVHVSRYMSTSLSALGGHIHG